MIDLVENKLLERLSLMQMLVGSTYKPVTLYQPDGGIYGDEASQNETGNRSKGKTKLPSISLTRLWPMIDIAETRPQHEVFTPSEEQQTVTLPDFVGGGEVTGPASWKVQPFPTPLTLHYQVDLLAAQKAHAHALFMMLLEALPVPFSEEISGKRVRFLPMGHPTNLDELEKPLLRTAFRYEVSNVWVDRQAAYVVPSIKDVDLGMEA